MTDEEQELRTDLSLVDLAINKEKPKAEPEGDVLPKGIKKCGRLYYEAGRRGCISLARVQELQRLEKLTRS
jgi:hypothetical protein